MCARGTADWLHWLSKTPDLFSLESGGMAFDIDRQIPCYTVRCFRCVKNMEVDMQAFSVWQKMADIMTVATKRQRCPVWIIFHFHIVSILQMVHYKKYPFADKSARILKSLIASQTSSTNSVCLIISSPLPFFFETHRCISACTVLYKSPSVVFVLSWGVHSLRPFKEDYCVASRSP